MIDRNDKLRYTTKRLYVKSVAYSAMGRKHKNEERDAVLINTSSMGERFGRFLVFGPPSEIEIGCHTVLCRCDCGNETVTEHKHLSNGERISLRT